MTDQFSDRDAAGNTQQAQRLLDQGFETIEAAAELPPEEAIRLCGQALDMFKRARELAVDDLPLQREARLAVATAFSQRGHHYRFDRNFAGSLADLSQGLSLNPANAVDYYYRAMSYLRNNNPRQARTDLIEYLKRGEDEYLRDQAHAHIAELAPGKEDPQAGSLHFRNTGMRLNSEASNAAQRRTEDDRPDWLGAVRLYNQAIAAFNRSQELNPEDKLARIGLITALKEQAEAYRQLEEYDLAITNYELALEIQPNNGQYLFLKAETLLQAGHTDLAKALFRDIEATTKDPGLKGRAQAQLAAKPKQVKS
jgi:tetratricopeptide (TPR) repeat protein